MTAWTSIVPALVVAATGMASQRAIASPGCDQVNAKAWNANAMHSFSKTVSGFAAGDALAISVICSLDFSCPARYPRIISLISGNGKKVKEGLGEITYTVTGADEDITLTMTVVSPYNHPASSAKCTPAGTDTK
jgi:hypothetical protein